MEMPGRPSPGGAFHAQEQMIRTFSLLAGLALCATGADAATTSKARTPARSSKPSPGPIPAIAPSPDEQRVADWIASSGDNHALPYAVIDKNTASRGGHRG